MHITSGVGRFHDFLSQIPTACWLREVLRPPVIGSGNACKKWIRTEIYVESTRYAIESTDETE